MTRKEKLKFRRVLSPLLRLGYEAFNIYDLLFIDTPIYDNELFLFFDKESCPEDEFYNRYFCILISDVDRYSGDIEFYPTKNELI